MAFYSANEGGRGGRGRGAGGRGCGGGRGRGSGRSQGRRSNGREQPQSQFGGQLDQDKANITEVEGL
eukprot:3071344-Ditylum_brightwellii.AAC.1